MDRLRILITNNTLANRAGSELYVRDLAFGLLSQGHHPIAYSTILGDVAQELRLATVPVINDLDALAEPPDVIHGHHHLDTMTALLRFPGVPAVSFCHGWLPWEEIPPRFPRVLRYIAVDQVCRDRLIYEHGISPARIRLLLNFVDLKRFKSRSRLPACPQRALIFSNQANEHTHGPAIREACARFGIQLDVIGLSTGNVCARPEEVLGNYDIIFAKARAALEGLAVGAAVILCDAVGAGPMVTTENMDHLRPLNFGIRTLRNSVTPDALAQELARYDPSDAAEVSQRIRATAGRDEAVEELLSVYRQVIAEYQDLPEYDVITEERAAAAYLRILAPRLKERDQATQSLESQLIEMKHTLQGYSSEIQENERIRLAQEEAIASLQDQVAGALSRSELLARQLAKKEQEVQTLFAELATRNAQLERITNSLGWRMLRLYGPIKYRFVLPVYHRIAGLFKATSKRAKQDQHSA